MGPLGGRYLERMGLVDTGDIEVDWRPRGL